MPQTFLQGLKLWAFQSAMGQGGLTLNGGCPCPRCRLVVCRGGRCVEVRGPLLPLGCWRSGAKPAGSWPGIGGERGATRAKTTNLNGGELRGKDTVSVQWTAAIWGPRDLALRFFRFDLKCVLSLCVRPTIVCSGFMLMNVEMSLIIDVGTKILLLSMSSRNKNLQGLRVAMVVIVIITVIVIIISTYYSQITQ